MITIGLVKEIQWLAAHSKTTVKVQISVGQINFLIEITPADELNVYCSGQRIWTESLSEVGFFGVESCFRINEIIRLITSGQSWEHLKWTEKLDFSPRTV